MAPFRFPAGLFRSLQQAQSVTPQDLLIAVDACEELLQEIDITHFCSHCAATLSGFASCTPSLGPPAQGSLSSSMEEGPSLGNELSWLLSPGWDGSLNDI